MNRYIRNIQLPEIGQAGQNRLSASSVLVVGAGALGSVASMYLAGSGVGRLQIVDFDNIDLTNLQRQLSFAESDLGKPKALTLAEKLRAINSEIKVEAINRLIKPSDLEELMGDCDLVLECSDNPATKYAVTEAAEKAGISYVLGGVAQWRGQVMDWAPGHAGYSDFFPIGADSQGYTPCAIGGVLGPVPGIVASIQATEAIKLLTGAGAPLLDRLLIIDALTMRANIIGI